MNVIEKPNIVALIREAECIGCTKCIQACPVDAILGSNKHMHTVIASECIGCQLCIAPCPVDCIDLISQPATLDREQRKELAMKRVKAKKKRLANEQTLAPIQFKTSIDIKKDYVREALARVKAKRS